MVSIGESKVIASWPKMLDISRYASDLHNNNLTGFTNIMYPFAESIGTTASASSGGGVCGCGG